MCITLTSVFHLVLLEPFIDVFSLSRACSVIQSIDIHPAPALNHCPITRNSDDPDHIVLCASIRNGHKSPRAPLRIHSVEQQTYRVLSWGKSISRSGASSRKRNGHQWRTTAATVLCHVRRTCEEAWKVRHDSHTYVRCLNNPFCLVWQRLHDAVWRS